MADWSKCPQDVCKHCDADIFFYHSTWYHYGSESYKCSRLNPNVKRGARAEPGSEDLPLAMVEEEQP